MLICTLFLYLLLYFFLMHLESLKIFILVSLLNDIWDRMVPAQINILHKIFVKPKDLLYLNFVSKQSHLYMFKVFLIFSQNNLIYKLMKIR